MIKIIFQTYGKFEFKFLLGTFIHCKIEGNMLNYFFFVQRESSIFTHVSVDASRITRQVSNKQLLMIT